MPDMMIDLTKLYSLHQASLDLDHAIREASSPELDWRPFSPSRFVYSFFTFNSIYSFNWKESIRTNSSRSWEKDSEGRRPEEIDQAKSLVDFSIDYLGEDSPEQFRDELKDRLQLFNVSDPITALENIVASNESKRIKGLRKDFPSRVKTLLESRNLRPDVLQASLYGSLAFIQTVRNNVFHGSKTRIQMQDEQQQERILIYTAILNSTCEMFFSSIEIAVPQWNRVPISYLGENFVAS